MNGSTITEFILLGLSHSCTPQLILFTCFLACYITILLGNFLIVVTVQAEPRLLHSPMYFFLSSLSLIDMSLGSVAAPKTMANLMACGYTISFGGCMAQLFFLHLFGGAEMLLLTVMAYDRYVAICHPLRYMAIMDRPRCFRLLMVCWVGGLIHTTIQMVVVAQLPFCGPNVLDNFYCDVPQVIKLACTETFVIELLMVANSSLLSLPCFLILLISYAVILATLQGHFRKGSGKALSTCSSHLIVVSLIYVPCVFVYLRPFSSSQVDKIASVFYTVVTPALNPIIYTLRNQEMKDAMGKLRNRCLFFLSGVRGQHA
ncbi:olfactory receptor 4Q3-like [Eublepharis macularius]|uniref:Olfactory receptor n=1 Tax=Eublepharis macularius TaxID=481883 RepID=A0AA97LC04_EUBMA|nr:olfactory receptor 4Q3-like [Eublepharis macularius]